MILSFLKCSRIFYRICLFHPSDIVVQLIKDLKQKKENQDILLSLGHQLYIEYQKYVRVFFDSISKRFLIHLDDPDENLNANDLRDLIMAQITSPDGDLEPEEGFIDIYNPIQYEDPKNDGKCFKKSLIVSFNVIRRTP